MKKNQYITASIAAILIGALLLCACGAVSSVPAETSAPAVTKMPASPRETQAAANVNAIRFRFADAQEGVARRYGQTQFFEGITQNDLDYRLQKQGATLDDYKALIKDNTRDFTDEEKKLITNAIAYTEQRFDEIGFAWPIRDEVVFISTTMQEEGDTWAYTHSTDIYMGSNLTAAVLAGTVSIEVFNEVMAHEIFHVLSRNVPELRAQIYAVIGFEICPPPEFSEDVRAHIISNPDVEDYDCAGEFTIEGKKEKATIVFYAPDFDESHPQTFMGSGYAAVVPYSQPDKAYAYTDVADFFDVVGYNTDYVIAAEECMADNFSFAIAHGMNMEYRSPEIIQAILKTLADFN